ncbi:transmembrane protein, putative, partial [Bodo saltans]
TGQRLGDVMCWRTMNVHDSLLHESGTTVLVVEGKTVNSTGPYTIHLPPHGIAQHVLQWWRATRTRHNYLFLDTKKADDPPEIPGHFLTHKEARNLIVSTQQRMKRLNNGDVGFRPVIFILALLCVCDEIIYLLPRNAWDVFRV